jgi:release factor glutamine methyltransferase
VHDKVKEYMTTKTALALQLEELTIAEALAEAVEQLDEAGIASAHLDARLLLARVLGVGREYLTMHSDAHLSDAEMMAYDVLVERRAAREPMAHILGQREFWSLNFRVTADTLDPRPDSETLMETVLHYVPNRNARLMIADFGVGTGCLLLSLLSEYPMAHGLGVDISQAALEVAQKNALSLGLAARTHFHHTSWGDNVHGRYDILVSNPPYIREGDMEDLEPEVTQYEPRSALVGGEDGLDAYRALMPDVKRLLAPKGIAVLEFGEGQAEDVIAIANQNGLDYLETVSDLAGIERCVVLVHAKADVLHLASTSTLS